MEIMAVKPFQILNPMMYIPQERMILIVKMVMEEKMEIMCQMNKKLEDMRNFQAWNQIKTKTFCTLPLKD